MNFSAGGVILRSGHTAKATCASGTCLCNDTLLGLVYSNTVLLCLYSALHISLAIYFSSFSAKGYSVPRAFIAAQSPMSHTKGDFWELVWQFRTPTIVLLTNFMDGSQVRTSHCTIQQNSFSTKRAPSLQGSQHIILHHWLFIQCLRKKLVIYKNCVYNYF